MSILQYLDQEYLRIQDHLAARTEDLPNLDLETIQVNFPFKIFPKLLIKG